MAFKTLIAEELKTKRNAYTFTMAAQEEKLFTRNCHSNIIETVHIQLDYTHYNLYI